MDSVAGKLQILSLCLLTVAGPGVSWGQIFKCVDGSTVAYQSIPCSKGQVEKQLPNVGQTAALGARADASASAEFIARADSPGSASARPSTPQSKTWPWRRRLVLGMSDDEVLNLPGWGIPDHIDRVKMPREWREEWTYGQSSGGERHLHFVNTVLVDIDDRVAATQYVQLMPRQSASN